MLAVGLLVKSAEIFFFVSDLDSCNCCHKSGNWFKLILNAASFTFSLKESSMFEKLFKKTHFMFLPKVSYLKKLFL